jgi:hypothetical protein
MNKIILVVLLVALVLSLGFNIKSYQQYNHNKIILIHGIYSSIIGVTRELDSFDLSSDANDLNEARIYLEQAANALIEVDDQIKYGTHYVDDKLYYPGILSFRFIGEGLLHRTKINDKTTKSILEDNVISDNEKEYIDLLNTDLKNIVKEMTLKESDAPNDKLSIENLNNIFTPFYDAWSRDHTPYELIWQ